MLATPDWSSFAENFSSCRCAVSTTSGKEGSVPGMRASTMAVFFSGRTTESTRTRRRSGAEAAEPSPPAPQRREPSPLIRSDSALPSRAEITTANVVFSPFGPSFSGTEFQPTWSAESAR